MVVCAVDGKGRLLAVESNFFGFLIGRGIEFAEESVDLGGDLLLVQGSVGRHGVDVGPSERVVVMVVVVEVKVVVVYMRGVVGSREKMRHGASDVADSSP
jgi:hypothetical protein